MSAKSVPPLDVRLQAAETLHDLAGQAAADADSMHRLGCRIVDPKTYSKALGHMRRYVNAQRYAGDEVSELMRQLEAGEDPEAIKRRDAARKSARNAKLHLTAERLWDATHPTKDRDHSRTIIPFPGPNGAA